MTNQYFLSMKLYQKEYKKTPIFESDADKIVTENRIINNGVSLE